MQEIKLTTHYVDCVNYVRIGLGETIGMGALRRQTDSPPVE